MALSLSTLHLSDFYSSVFTAVNTSKCNVCQLIEVVSAAPVFMIGVTDEFQHGRGVALADFNGDGKTDIVYGNWNGPHRLYLQTSDSKFRVRSVQVCSTRHGDRKVRLECCVVQDIATGGFAQPSPVRTVIAADFDNDQELEVFFNNIAYRGDAPNRLFRFVCKQLHKVFIPNGRTWYMAAPCV